MRILIVDDHPIYAEGLRNILASMDYEDIRLAHSAQAALELARDWEPQVVFMDISMPEMDGIEATRRLKQCWPEAKVVMLTSMGNEENLLEAIKAGASGFLLKTLSGQDLLDCIRQLEVGKTPFAEGLQDILLMEIRRGARTQGPRQGPLSPRQAEILSLLADGLTYKEVGAKLRKSERSVKYEVELIKRCLGLSSKADLTAYWRSLAG